MFNRGFEKVRMLIKCALFGYWCYQIVMMIFAMDAVDSGALLYLVSTAAAMFVSWVIALVLLLFVDLCETVDSQHRRISDINADVTSYVRANAGKDR